MGIPSDLNVKNKNNQMKDLIEKTVTRQFKAIFPETLNANGTLFGGEAMRWMDEVAYITATRFTRQRMFTITTDRIRFLKAVCPDSIVEVVGFVEKAEAVKLTVKVEIYREDMYAHGREKAVEATFVFAALNEKRSPQRIRYPFDFEKECSNRETLVAVD
jgi:acyl-CoA hydrolase